MDKLCGVGSLQVVYHRFADGVQVVRCVLDFYKSVSEVEQSYSVSINKLVQSSAYTFHSNILMQWLGSDPYEEIGTVKCSWQRLGSELSRLADHHANKANDYITTVRKQLQSLLPRLEEMRIKLKNKIQQLKAAVDAAEKNNFKEKQKYFQIGSTCLKMRERIIEAQSQRLGDTATTNPKLTKLNNKETVLTKELEIQERAYRSAHRSLVEAYKDFSRDTRDVYKEVEEIEKERVETLKLSLQDFAKALSNTAPTYLEGMKRIVMSVDDIDASSDIVSFVESQKHLMDPPRVPQLEQHQATCQDHSEEVFHTSKETDSMCNGNRTPSLRSQRSLSDDELLDSDEAEPDKVKGQSSDFKQPAKVKAAQKGDVRRDMIPDGHGQVKQTARYDVTKVAAKPVVKPKPGVRSALVVSENSTSSGSSDHMSSPSSHVTSIIEKIEVSHRHPSPDSLMKSPEKQNSPSSGRSTTLPRARLTSQPCSEPVKTRTHSSKSSNPTSLPAKERPRTKTVPTLSCLSLPHQTPSVSTEGETDPVLLRMLSKLQLLARENDCYRILGVEPTADTNELTRAWREKNKEFHPDHFTKEPDRKAKAEEQLSLINQIYQDVLKSEDTRSLYDQLCHFRQFYGRIPEQVKGLDKALNKLKSLHKTMKKAQFPLPVLEEMELAVTLIQARINQLFTIE